MASSAAAPPAAKEKDAASAAATFSAKLAEGVKDLFLHGGEALGSPPIRNVTFAKNLKITNSFISAVEKLDTQSLSTLMRSVKPVVDGVKEAQKKTEESVRGAEETTKEIDIAREAYRPVATRGSILYFVVADFATIDPSNDPIPVYPSSTPRPPRAAFPDAF